MLAAGRRDGDLARADGARALVERAAAELGGLDVVVNGAGAGFRPQAFEDVSEDDVDAALGATVKGSFFVTQAAAPHLRASARPRRDDRGRRRLPALAVVRRTLRGEGGPGDADADARTRARAGGTGVRRRAGTCRRGARAGGAAGRRDGARPRRGRRTTWLRRSSIWPARSSSRGRRSSSTAAVCSKPAGALVRRSTAWERC